MSLLRSTAVIGGLTLVSRVTGFAREILMAVVMGAGPVTDAFMIAFRFPNLFRRVFAEGAFNAAFVPLYSGRLEADGGAEADRLASETFMVMSLVLFALVVAACAAMPWLIYGLAPGLAEDPTWRGQASVMTITMMPYILFMSLTALLGGVLNARGRFAAFAIAPVLLNLLMLAALVYARDDAAMACLATPDAGECPLVLEASRWWAARVLSVSVLVGGVAQLVFVWFGAARQGVKIRLGAPKLSPGVRRVAALGLPGALAAGVTQINLIVGQIIASLQAGAVSWLGYSDRIYQLPLGIIGIAMGVALLPALSRKVKAGDDAGARESLNSALELAALFTLPATAALLAAPWFFVMAAFDHGQFAVDPANARNVPLALAAYAAGLPAFIGVKVLSPGYFAREDTKTPMIFAGVAVVVNIGVGAGLFFALRETGFGFVGLAIGTSVSAYVNMALLAVGLARAGHFSPDGALLGRLVRVTLAAGVMGAVVWAMAQWAGDFLHARAGAFGFVQDLGLAGALALAGFAVFGVVALGIGAARLGDLRAALRRG